MTSINTASQIIRHLGWKQRQVVEENVDLLCNQCEALNLITLQENKELHEAAGSRERTAQLIDIITQKGEDACDKFLDQLLKSFPALHGVSDGSTEGRKTSFYELVEKMKMDHHLTSKLTLSDILSIGVDTLHEKPCEDIKDHPWNFLRKLMALNRTARDILIVNDQSTVSDDDEEEDDEDDDDDEEDVDDDDLSLIQDKCNSPGSIHPLDVLCVLLHCSDSFLQQVIVCRMAMCQFAVPLLLPANDGSHCTLLLWAMRDIVKKWRPQSLAESKGFIEENVVNTPLPIFSFVRLGERKVSKSIILNQILNPAQELNNFFLNDNVDGGHIGRKISDGLVEMSWYFPSGKPNDVFTEPLAVTNLRGDLGSSWDQFMFLTRVSSAVFIFIESISEKQVNLLSSCCNTNTKYYLITPGKSRQSRETQSALQRLKPVLNIKQSNIIKWEGETNKAELTNKLQTCIKKLLSKDPKSITMRQLQAETRGLPIYVDEDVPACQKAMKLARKITEEIQDVAKYKESTMKLQRDLWKQISKIEKELCRMTNLGSKDVQQYQDELRQKRLLLHEKQHNHTVARGISLFFDAIMHLSKIETQYFLKWMKFELDSVARDHFSALQAKYKEKCKDKSGNKEELKKLGQEISESCLGIEHFLHEMGQFYEAELSMVKENKKSKNERKFIGLPGVAADLMLNGFPIELIDGDVSSIPLQWITDILTDVHVKTGGKSRMRVITALGVQSMGKSTLLNTIFGLQFPVASGRCTRGAFMTLLKVKENFKEDLGCEFIIVMDNEGLKAPELSSLEDSSEHDNELATLMVGLSDITIINVAMENTTEIKDILQIVIHAFLRMKEVGKKPSCQFAHQNVSDVSAYDKNMKDRQEFLEQLNEMAKLAAGMEKKSDINTFSDVMDYDMEKDNWYFPGLWHGVPPMAPVSSGYSTHVCELKKYLLELLKAKQSLHKPLTIPEFIAWIESLWNAVKHEKFIFSFRNSLVAEAYNKLSVQFSKWEWEFQKTVYNWLISTETNIKNQSTESLLEGLCTEFKSDLKSLLIKEETKMKALLENYFGSKDENAHLVERYKEDFVLSTEFLRKELDRNAQSKLEEAVSIQKGKFKIQEMQRNSQKLIEDKITDLLCRCREKNQKLSEAELVEEFEEMWKKAPTDLQLEKLQKHNVSKSILQRLVNNMSHKGPAVNDELLQVKNLEDWAQLNFVEQNEKYIESRWLKKFIDESGYNSKEPYEKINNFALSLINKCSEYVKGKVNTAEDYNDTYCQELLRMINTELSKQEKDLHFSVQFELDIKRCLFARASRDFQKMHDTFIAENDPKLCLEKLKPQYLETFLSTFQDKDLCQTKAKEFCEQCLKPAITDYVFQQLGKEIVNDILHSKDNKTFSSRTFFQNVILKELMEKNSFQEYLQCICKYEEYTKAWILKYMEKYANAETLKPIQVEILQVTKTIKGALSADKCLASPSISDFLKNICEMLKKHLVIPQKELNVVTFQNTATVHQFSSDIQYFLIDTEAQILSELQSMDITSVLSMVTMKPQDELFKKVVGCGCGKQCPFCKVPCEAGGDGHTEHFSTIHRPQGLGSYRDILSQKLCTSICSTSVISDRTFCSSDTGGARHPYKEYRTIYPDWHIQPDPSIDSLDYWKYTFVQFIEEFAKEYDARPPDLPSGWETITKEKALESLKKVFNEK
ncbi:up-regulator of cell proliferation-like [Hyperolius riggenbachi]|uniref:up-regulator of cell proliferation-like n=1 Tax=Hyperolius riggenbachi TaxID=752182 RepID=UPI0035A2725D